MKKKIFVVLLVIATILLSGCGKDNDKPKVKYENYKARYIDNYDCPVDNVYDIKTGDYITDDYKIFYISDKKNTETENHCKYRYKNPNNYRYLGSMDTYSDGSYILYVDNHNNVIGFDNKGNVNNNYKKIVDVDKIYKTKNIKYYYYYQRSIGPTLEYYFNDKIIHYYLSSGYNYDITIPEGEKIIHHGFHEKETQPYEHVRDLEKYPLMIITDKGRYNVGISDDDRCHEYDDVECTYTLVETRLYDHIFENYNVRFFDGDTLITKGGSVYTIKNLH